MANTTNVTQDYKTRKEAFVSNLSGGSMLEVNYVTLVGPAAVFLWSALQSRTSLFSPYDTMAFIVDFLLNVMAILAATTLYPEAPIILIVSLVTPAAGLYFLMEPRAARRSTKSKPTSNKLDPFPIRPFITVYRGSMMIITCIAILAVDFRIFPRRFAKTENWGTSLMDMGVGSFVFSAGLVSARSVFKTENVVMDSPLLGRVTQSLRHGLPLILLGLIRLVSVKGLDYAEHASEYGVHWNFFFTLGFLPPLVELAHAVTSLFPSYQLLAVGIAVFYQALLEFTDLKAFILISSRTTLLSKNREGIFSLFGYLAIFLAGRGTGMTIIPRAWTSMGGAQSRKHLLFRLARLCVTWWSIYIVVSERTFSLGLGLPVSRRLANLPYVLWVVAFNVMHLLLFCGIETLFFPAVHQTTDANSEYLHCVHATPEIMRAMNQGGLYVFLIANLLTGLVNLTVNTLDAGTAMSMGILMAYSAAFTATALCLDSIFSIGPRLKKGWKRILSKTGMAR